MLDRVLEPEVMDSPQEALDYDSMDHTEVNRRFVDDLLLASLPAGDVLDVGTGTAQIPIELCRRVQGLRVRAIDAAGSMLELAQQNIERAALSDRIVLECVDAKRLPYPDGSYQVIISNSIVHHIPDPKLLLQELWRVLAPGGLLFLRDLERPSDEQQLADLVKTYAADCSSRQRKLFAESLHAALTVEELRGLFAAHGVAAEAIQSTSDRHWTCCCFKR